MAMELTQKEYLFIRLALQRGRGLRALGFNERHAPLVGPDESGVTAAQYTHAAEGSERIIRKAERLLRMKRYVADAKACVGGGGRGR